MANNIQVKITNLPEIKRAFNKAPALMTKELNFAIRKSIFTIEGLSKSKTPVDTSRLVHSTYTKYGSLMGEVGTNTNYDIFVHWGTRFMPARPYLKDAVEDSNELVQEYFTKAVQNVLDDIGRNV